MNSVYVAAAVAVAGAGAAAAAATLAGAGGGGRLTDQGRVDGDRFGGVVGFVDPHQSVGELEHLRSQRDDDELGVLGPVLGGK